MEKLLQAIPPQEAMEEPILHFNMTVTQFLKPRNLVSGFKAVLNCILLYILTEILPLTAQFQKLQKLNYFHNIFDFI